MQIIVDTPNPNPSIKPINRTVWTFRVSACDSAITIYLIRVHSEFRLERGRKWTASGPVWDRVPARATMERPEIPAEVQQEAKAHVASMIALEVLPCDPWRF